MFTDQHCAVFILRFKPLKYKVALCALAWIVFLLIAWLMTALAGRANTVLIWFLPTLSIFLYCYFSVLCTLKQPRPAEGENRRGDEIKGKAFNIILVHLVFFSQLYTTTCGWIFEQRKSYFKYCFRSHFEVGLLCGHIQPLLYLHRVGMPSCIKR